MKLPGLTTAVLFAFFAVNANSASTYLRVNNKIGDYWVFRFDGLTLNVTFDVNAKSQQASDRNIKLTDIDFTFGGLPLSSIISRPEGGNIIKFRILCKTPGCVYSNYDSKKYNELDIFCNLQQDCINFAPALPLQ